MRTTREVEAVLALLAAAETASAVARRTRIPRNTVRDWQHGHLPGRGAPARSCPICRPGSTTLDATAYGYLLGLYLGNGYISKGARTYCLRIFLDAAYLQEVSMQHRDVFKSRAVPDSEELLARDRRPFVRGLIHSDGCRVVANDRDVAGVRYHFSNKSEDIKRIFCDGLGALGIY